MAGKNSRNRACEMGSLSIELLTKINQRRSSEGQKGLKWTVGLSVIALKRAKGMFTAARKGELVLKVPFQEYVAHIEGATDHYARDVITQWSQEERVLSKPSIIAARYVGIGTYGDKHNIFTSFIVTSDGPSGQCLEQGDAEAHPDLVTQITAVPRQAPSKLENMLWGSPNNRSDIITTPSGLLPDQKLKNIDEVRRNTPVKSQSKLALKKSSRIVPALMEDDGNGQVHKNKTAKARAKAAIGNLGAPLELEVLGSEEREELYTAAFKKLNSQRERDGQPGFKWDFGLYKIARDYSKKVFSVGAQSPLEGSRSQTSVVRLRVENMSTRCAIREICRKLARDAQSTGTYRYAAIGLYGSRKNLVATMLASKVRA